MATPGRLGRPGQTENDEEGRFQTMTTYEPAPVSRWLKAIGLLVLATAVLAVAGCGDDTPAVCDSLGTLSSDVDGLKDISLEDGENAEDVVAEVEQSLDTIRGDLDTVKTDAEAELSEPIAGLESSLDALSTEVDSVKAAGTLTPEAVQAVGTALTAVGTSWETLKTSAPDCDL